MTARTLRQIMNASLAAVSLAALAACGGETGDANAAPAAAAPVTVSPENLFVAQSAQIASGPAISGALAAEREATVAAQVPGSVVSVNADQGSRVAQGALLAKIDDRTLADAYLSARSLVTTAQSTADLSARELSRSERLSGAGAIAERELEQARWNNTNAQSQLADAKARLTLAEKQLNDAQVRAPFAGIVSVRSVSTGDIVQPGKTLFMVVDPRSMRLEASVPAEQLNAVKVGAPVSFTVSGYPGRSFTGKVSRVSPAADPSTGQVQIVVSIPNERNDLVSGLFAEGRIQAAAHMGVVVPATAVDTRGVRPWVVRVKNGRAERIEVAVGTRDDETERVEITSGIAAGDTLLLGAAQGISPGTPVKPGTASDTPVTKN
jgi:membrane fusion protein, multidrug efflux system